MLLLLLYYTGGHSCQSISSPVVLIYPSSVCVLECSRLHPLQDRFSVCLNASLWLTFGAILFLLLFDTSCLSLLRAHYQRRSVLFNSLQLLLCAVSVDFGAVKAASSADRQISLIGGPFILFSERPNRFLLIWVCHRCWVLGVTVVLLTACSWCLLYEQTMSFYETRGAHQCHRCHREAFFLLHFSCDILSVYPLSFFFCLPLNYETSALNMVSFCIVIVGKVCAPLIPIHKSIGPFCATTATAWDACFGHFEEAINHPVFITLGQQRRAVQCTCVVELQSFLYEVPLFFLNAASNYSCN